MRHAASFASTLEAIGQIDAACMGRICRAIGCDGDTETIAVTRVASRNLHFLLVISTCEMGITTVERSFDTISVVRFSYAW